LKTLLGALLFALAGLFAYSTLSGPNGVPAMLDKQRQVRELQQQNSSLQQEIERRRERIQRLRDSRTEQELEIRQRLKLLKERETTYILQDPPKQPPPE